MLASPEQNWLFSVYPPLAEELPLVVEVPHAGLSLDAETLAHCTAPGQSIGRDADLYVDELYENSPHLGATLITAQASRYLCDLNRSEEDLDSHTTASGRSVSSPHGVVWRRTTSGRPALASPLPSGEIERRLQRLYRPYHATLEALLLEKQKKFGFVLLLCGHSMPSFGRLGDRRADVVPGTQGGSTLDAGYLDIVEDSAAGYGLDVAHDAPYRGGYTTVRHGLPGRGRHALQIELARRLYMDEPSLSRKGAAFVRTREFCDRLVTALGEFRPTR